MKRIRIAALACALLFGLVSPAQTQAQTDDQAQQEPASAAQAAPSSEQVAPSTVEAPAASAVQTPAQRPALRKVNGPVRRPPPPPSILRIDEKTGNFLRWPWWSCCCGAGSSRRADNAAASRSRGASRSDSSA
jgi:hypothetical protein